MQMAAETKLGFAHESEELDRECYKIRTSLHDRTSHKKESGAPEAPSEKKLNTILGTGRPSESSSRQA
jgi:hypothetical protein